MFYPANFQADPSGAYVITFRDIPEAITQGDNLEEALQMATDALVRAMEFYFEDQRSVPLPSPAKAGEQLIELPLSISAKVLLLNEMLQQRVRPVELARKMALRPQEVNRLLKLDHKTKIDTISDALKVLGCKLDLMLAR